MPSDFKARKWPILGGLGSKGTFQPSYMRVVGHAVLEECTVIPILREGLSGMSWEVRSDREREGVVYCGLSREDLYGKNLKDIGVSGVAP